MIQRPSFLPTKQLIVSTPVVLYPCGVATPEDEVIGSWSDQNRPKPIRTPITRLMLTGSLQAAGANALPGPTALMTAGNR